MASTYLIRSTPSESFNKLTVSCWFKGMADGTQRNFWGLYDNTDTNRFFGLYYSSNGSLYGYWKQDGGVVFTLGTTQKFSDPTSWYHFVMTMDTTLATAADRIKFYVNGERVTSFEDGLDTITQSKNCDLMNGTTDGRMQLGGGKIGSTQYYWNGSMSHCHMCVGYAYDASYFGQTDSTSGIWKTKTGPSVSYGDNGGVWLKDGSQLTDSSSNSNTLTVGAGTITPTKDNPSNNFATFNSLYVPTSNLPTFSNANTTVTHPTTAGAWRTMAATLGVSTGKWYWECIGGNGSGHIYNGVCSPEWLQSGNPSSTGPSGEMGYNLSQPSVGIYGVNGNLVYSNTSGNGNLDSGYSDTYVDSDYISTYLDLDNHKIYFSKNGTIQNSGTGQDIQTGFTYLPCISLYNSAAAGASINFGNGTFFSTALTGTTYSDNDSIGTFKYSPNYGGAATFDGSAKNFMALCTKNLKAYGG